MDRWHPADPTANPYDPATKWVAGEYGYTGSTANPNSEHGLQNARYLRLKNLEIGYSLPKKWLTKVGIENVRIYASAYNLLTITGLDYLDPEFYIHPSDGGASNMGYFYPINKTYTIGLKKQKNETSEILSPDSLCGRIRRVHRFGYTAEKYLQ